ncbi:MAG: hypothetical protein AB2L13_04560 [Spirochaetota bacterium]
MTSTAETDSFTPLALEHADRKGEREQTERQREINNDDNPGLLPFVITPVRIPSQKEIADFRSHVVLPVIMLAL